ncbi:MAG: hypothetical protein AB1505_32375, partial [Candidatus Latescibacterota bacterium]
RSPGEEGRTMPRTRRQVMLALLLALGLTASRSTTAGAGAWSQAPGGLYAKVSGIYYSADQVFNTRGDRVDMGFDEQRFSARQTFVYVEYGLAPNLTLVGQAAAAELLAEDRFLERRTRGIGDVEAGLKYQLAARPLVVSPLVRVKVPTGYHEDYDPALGTGEADLEVRLLAGQSLFPLPLYGNAEAGYRLRGGAYANQVSYLAECGGKPHVRLFAKAYVEGAQTLSSATADTGIAGLTQVSEGDYTKGGLNASLRVWQGLWIDLLWERALLGENVGAGSSWGLGLAWIR